MLTAKQLDALERDARLPDYGSKCYKPDVVLRLIEHIRAIEPKQQSLFETEPPTDVQEHELLQRI